MRDGCIVQDGTPRELYESPADSYAAGFFGETNHVALGAQHFVVRPENITLRDAAGEGAASQVAPPFAVCEECLRAAGRIQDLRYRGEIHEVRILLDEGGILPGDHIVVAHSRDFPIQGPGQAVQVEINREALVRVG